MFHKILLMSFLWAWLVIPNHIFSQAEKYTASEFNVRLFTSSHFMGYLEPCG